MSECQERIEESRSRGRKRESDAHRRPSAPRTRNEAVDARQRQARAGLRAAPRDALISLSLALPAGMLADRFGRRATFLAGHGVLLLAYLTTASGEVSRSDLAVCILLLGGYYALTEGVLMALASATLPAPVRSTGLAMLTTMTSLGRLAASLAFGAVWAAYGPTQALVRFLIALGGATVLAAATLRGYAGDDGRNATT